MPMEDWFAKKERDLGKRVSEGAEQRKREKSAVDDLKASFAEPFEECLLTH